ncbi:hypothetical protein [Deinococcus ruber]|uniref:hypothetical protein n=1 Tax=Deinococcus ruber TaxID=1848197 RepID=UPI0016669A79|nr:hypothetical protein [Deinococcus ruber]
MNESTWKWLLLANLIVWFLVALFSTIVAHGTGTLLGGAGFQGSLCAYLIQRHTRRSLGA